MKLTHKLCGAALLAVVGVAVAVPSATKADTSVDGKGKITFTKDTSGSDPIYIPDPDDTDTGSGSDRPQIPGPGNTDPADRKIIFVSDLDFEVHERLTDSNEKTYFAKAYEAAGEVMPNFVKFKDVRTEADNNNYMINAQITKQFENGTAAASEKILNGATITYGNAKVSSVTNAATLPTAPVVSSVVATGGKTTVLDNTGKAGRTGFGTHDITFGSLVNNTADSSVMLSIPGNVLLANGEYQATITWYIEDAK